MVKVRQDAWSHEDDLLLAETVLRHIREGSTQLKAFDEVGDQLNRTSAACGFRWNAEIRQKYISAIDLAKRQRKEKKRALAQHTKQQPEVVSLPSPSPSTFSVAEFVMEAAEENTMEMPISQATQSSDLDLNQVIQFLQNMQHQGQDTEETQRKLERSEQFNQQLTSQVTALEKELAATRQQLETIKEDYNTFIRIMERARKMTVFQGEEEMPPAFRMDQNGNLQQLAQNSN